MTWSPRAARLRLAGQLMKFFYVYVIISERNERYFGITTNLKTLPAKHNAGGVSHTSKFRPWRVEVTRFRP